MKTIKQTMECNAVLSETFGIPPTAALALRRFPYGGSGARAEHLSEVSCWNTLGSFPGKPNLSAAFQQHSASRAISARLIGTGTNNSVNHVQLFSLRQEVYCQAFPLLPPPPPPPGPPSFGQIYASANVIHPAQPSNLKRHAARGRGKQLLQSLHSDGKVHAGVDRAFNFWCHIFRYSIYSLYRFL